MSASLRIARVAALVLLVLGCGPKPAPSERPADPIQPPADAAVPQPADAAADAAAPGDASVAVVVDAPPPRDAGAPIGNAGAICYCRGGTADKSCVAKPCTGGLVCGYPCGVQGCHSVCMTAEEAEQAKYRPSAPRR